MIRTPGRQVGGVYLPLAVSVSGPPAGGTPVVDRPRSAASRIRGAEL